MLTSWAQFDKTLTSQYEILSEKLPETFWEISSNLWKALTRDDWDDLNDWDA